MAYAKKHGWAMVGPNFRGANDHPEACGGEPAVQDIVDAVNFAKAEVKIDSRRIYIIGGSGGGHMTLLMAGIHDGWAGSVPVGHSFRAFNALAAESDRVSEADIAKIEESQKVPDELAYRGEPDPFYGKTMRIHFRRTSGNVRFTLFEGGHGGNFPAGLDFCSRQERGRPADYSLPSAAVGGCEKRLGR